MKKTICLFMVAWLSLIAGAYADTKQDAEAKLLSVDTTAKKETNRKGESFFTIYREEKFSTFNRSTLIGVMQIPSEIEERLEGATMQNILDLWHGKGLRIHWSTISWSSVLWILQACWRVDYEKEMYRQDNIIAHDSSYETQRKVEWRPTIILNLLLALILSVMFLATRIFERSYVVFLVGMAIVACLVSVAPVFRTFSEVLEIIYVFGIWALLLLVITIIIDCRVEREFRKESNATLREDRNA